MFRLLKALPLALAIAALIVFAAFAASCGSSNSNARFVNAIPDSAAALDIDINGTKEFTVAFPVASGSTYVSVPSGSDTIEGLAASSTTVAFPNQTITLNSGSQYTLVGTGLLSGTVTVLNPLDTNTAPANGTVSFRVINASQFGPLGGGTPADIYILANPVTCQIGVAPCTATISGLAYQSTSGYVNQNYNSNGQGYTMYVTVAGNPTPVWTFPLSGGSSSVGTIRTLVLTDGACTGSCSGGAMNTQPIILDDLN
jgi:Domain of unknown function (DUF4397)